MSLTPDSFGQLYDPFNGVADIKAGTLRVLHDNSFIDDPTRLYRLVRFAGRFGWRADEQTEKLAIAAIRGKAPALLSRSRLARELLCVLNERAAKQVFMQPVSAELFGFIGAGVGWCAALTNLVPDESENTQEDSLTFEYERLGALACSMPEGALFIKSLGLRRELCLTLLETVQVCAEQAAPSDSLSESQKRIIRAVYPGLPETALKRRFVRGQDLAQFRIIGPQVAKLLKEYAQMQWNNKFIDRPAALSALMDRFRPQRPKK